MNHGARRDRVRRELEGRADALLVTSLLDIRYLTGFTGSSAQLLIGEPDVIFTDGRYQTQISDQVPDLRTVIYAQNEAWQSQVASEVPAGNRVAFDPTTTSMSAGSTMRDALGGSELVEMAGLIPTLRRIKDRQELDSIRRAQEITETAVTSVMDAWKSGTEKELAMDIEWAIRTGGADGLAFDVIVASGAHSALPHARPRDIEIGQGHILIDVGAKVDGYCSDMTRVWLRSAPDEIVRGHEAVEKALEAACAVVRDGTPSRDVDAAARDVLETEGLGDAFVHSAGHAIGLEAHEFPKLATASDDVLRAGMVITVEPGIYLPGVGGIRIEDLIVVTETGFENLTRLNRVCR